MGELYQRIHSWENLCLAYRKASRGKRGLEPAARFEVNLEDELIAVRDELRSQDYLPGQYKSFIVHEPKRRLISAAPFRDRVVHHALCNVVEPRFERRFIFDSYANRRGKGTHRALDRAQRFARRYRYVLPCDIRQHFASIDHAILLDNLAGLIVDDEVLELCRRILASGEGVLDAAYDMVYFSGDDLFAVNRPRGLPIGNLTSQFWSNCYLDPLDQFVKRELGCRGYLRYCDDFLLFADDKPRLWAWKERIVERLEQLRLTLHSRRAQVRPVSVGLPFLGFLLYPTHRRLRRRNVLRYRRHLASLIAAHAAGEAGDEKVWASIRGWVAHAEYGATWGLRKSVLGGVALRRRRGSAAGARPIPCGVPS